MKVLGEGSFGKVSVVKCLQSSILEKTEDEGSDPRRVKPTQKKKLKIANTSSINIAVLNNNRELIAG
jgi:hypothetical protein